MKTRLVIMSDSHGNDDLVWKIIDENPEADYYIHLGDLCSDAAYFPNFIMVRGNNDYDYTIPNELVTQFNGVRMYLVHSSGFGYNREASLVRMAKLNECSIVLFGHTHQWCDETVDGIRLLNPGSLQWNRDRSQLGYYLMTIDENSSIEINRKYVNVL